jgi:L-asparaginase
MKFVFAVLFLIWTTAASAQPSPSLTPAQASFGGQALPHVHFIATGGTISNRDPLTALGAGGGRLTAEDLVATAKGVDRYARVTFEQFSNVASSELTVTQWLQLSRRINEAFGADNALAGIVVTSGTDTLEETAFFLHLTVRDPRPVVVVGAMRNASAVGYEGPANLLEGIRVAAEPAARNKGVLVVLNDEINSARDVTKTDAHRLQTFQSRTHGLLGVVDSDRVVFYREILQRHTTKTEFDVNLMKDLPRVDVIMVYQSAPGDLIKAAVDAGARGIVMATAGAGATSGTQNEGLDYAARKGVFIVTSTRTGAGRIEPPPTRGRLPNFQPTEEQLRRRAFTVAAEDHIPVKARILLMLALTKTSSRDEIQRIFTEY